MAVPNEDCPFVTKDFLTDILRRYESKDDLRVIDFTLRRLRPAEQDVITKVRGVTATVSTADDIRQCSMILKVVVQRDDCHMDEAMEDELMLFQKEEISYDKLIRAMERISNRQGALVSVPAPSLMKSERAHGIKFLLLEDLSTQGFCVTTFDDKLDYDHCKLAVEGMATFHALSLALGQGSVENLRTEYEALFLERYAPGPMIRIFKAAAKFALDVCLNVVRLKISDNDARFELEKLQSMDLSKLFEIAFAPDSTFNVMCHRDFKPGNMMFKYVNLETGRKVVTDFKFIDLQIVTVGSPAVDLVTMIYTSTTEAFRRQYLEKVLRDYYAKFVSVLNMVDLAVPDCFTYELLLKHFRKRAGFGVVFAWIMYIVFSKTTTRNNIPAAERYDMEVFDGLCKDIANAGDDVNIVETFCGAVKEHYFDHI